MLSTRLAVTASALLCASTVTAEPTAVIPDNRSTTSAALHEDGWQAWPAINTPPGQIRIGKRLFHSLTEASNALADNDRLDLGSGIYRQALVIQADNIVVRGHGHVIFERASAQGKGAIITVGDGIQIVNIECREITVPDSNGACVRHEGQDLLLDHVYFHHAEQGLLTGSRPGHVRIINSRFVQLGKRGRAHGIYVGGGSLSIDRSQFLSAKDEGHEIKSRAKTTHITRSVIASLDGNDSRLIDLSQGGVLTITDSVLAQGPRSANPSAIGIGLEKPTHSVQKATLTGNIILLERKRGNRLFQLGKGIPAPLLHNNLVISHQPQALSSDNLWLQSRKALKLGPHPELPPVPQR